MDSLDRRLHVQAGVAAAARGAILGAFLGLAFGIGEMLFSAVAGELLLVTTPLTYAVPYVLIGLLGGALLGVVSLSLDAALRRVGWRRPRMGILIPLVASVGTTAYGFLLITSLGAPWSLTEGLGWPVPLLCMFALSLVGYWLSSRADRLATSPGTTGAGRGRGLEIMAVAALSACGISFLVVRSGWLRNAVLAAAPL